MFENPDLPEFVSDVVNAFTVAVDPKEFDAEEFLDNCTARYSYCRTRLAEFREQVRGLFSLQYRYAEFAYNVSRCFP